MMDFYKLDANNLQTGEGWVMVFPRGLHYVDKYETSLNFNDKFYDSVKKWWEGSTFKKPYLDKGHEFNEKYGEFTEYRVTDKGMEMYLKLTEEGKELIKSDKYSYLSPFFGKMKDSTGKEFDNVVLAVSLVNSPALMVLDKIRNQISLSTGGIDKTKKGGSGMELTQRIAGMLKLDLAADDMSILTKIKDLLDAGATIEVLKAEVARMAGELEAANLACKTAQDEKKKMETELSAIKEKEIKSEAGKVVDEAISLGQYHPSLKDMKVEAYIKDKDSVLKELAVIPKAKPGTQLTLSADGSSQISESDKLILLDAGYDLTKPEDVALALKALAIMNKEDK